MPRVFYGPTEGIAYTGKETLKMASGEVPTPICNLTYTAELEYHAITSNACMVRCYG